MSKEDISEGTYEVPSEVIEQHERALADLVKGDDAPDIYVSGDGESEEEMIARIDSEAAKHANSEGSATDRRVRLLEEELATTREMIRKMVANQGGLNVETVARATTDEEEDRKWEGTFKKIRTAGGYCTVIMHASEDPARNFPVAVGINGHSIMLQRNVPLKVHVSVLEVLVRSRVNSVAPFVNERGERDWKSIRYQCYPFSLLDQGVQIKAKRGQLLAA